MRFFILSLILLFTLTGCENNEAQKSDNYNAEKTSSENNVINEATTPIQEEELSSFSTTIYTKTDERQNNVALACQELSGYVVAPRRNFFFL